MNLSLDYNWIPFHIVATSSEDYESPADHLSSSQYGVQKGWECSRTPQFPIEIIVRFHFRTQVDHVLIGTKFDKPIPSIEFQIGDGLSGGFQDCEYRISGKAENINNIQTQVKLQGIGNFFKIVMREQPKRSPHNPMAQVSIATLKIWGANRHYLSGVKNEQIPQVGNIDIIDKLLIGLGVPVDQLNWFEEDDRNYQYAPIDNDSRETLDDLKRIRDQALKHEDFEAMKQLKKDMRFVFELGKKILNFKRELGLSIVKEDYGRSIELKQQLQNMIRERDRIDALYETSRYEKLISLKRPNTAEYLRFVNQYKIKQKRHLDMLDAQEKMNADALRRKRDLEEQNRRRLMMDKIKPQQPIQKEQVIQDIDTTPWWDKKEATQQTKQKKRQKVKQQQEDALPNFNNPFAFNEGDVDLELYLNPLLAQAGEKLPQVSHEVLRRLHQLGYLNIFGARAWTGISGESWRIREASSQAVLNFLEMPLPNRYADGKTKKLFLSSMELAKMAMEDKIMQVYFIGLKILSTALAPPVCGSDVSPQVINRILKELTPILLLKIEELNYRARDISLHTLLSVFRHPAAKIGILVQSCLDKLIMDPNYQSLFVPPDKQPQRVMISKLEVILNVLQEFGYDEREFNYEDIFFILAAPCLFHPSNEVRLLSIEVIAALYQLVGQDIKIMVDSIENLKPGLREQIQARFDQVDQEHGVPKQLQKQLSLVIEQEQEDGDQQEKIQQQQKTTKQQLNNKSLDQSQNNASVVNEQPQKQAKLISQQQEQETQINNTSQQLSPQKKPLNQPQTNVPQDSNLNSPKSPSKVQNQIGSLINNSSKISEQQSTSKQKKQSKQTIQKQKQQEEQRIKEEKEQQLKLEQEKEQELKLQQQKEQELKLQQEKEQQLKLEQQKAQEAADAQKKKKNWFGF